MSGAAHVSARFRALDGWRGACALLVALHHLSLPCWLFYQPLVREAWLFVDFFFVLSGFVLAHAYGAKLYDSGLIRSFMIRRFGRLWPLHVTILAAMIALEFTRLAMQHNLHGVSSRPAFTGNNSVFAIFTNLLLIQGLGFHQLLTWNGPSWSISTEFYTYIIFAVVFFLVPSRGGRAAVSALLALLGLTILARFGPLGMQETSVWAEWRCLFGFFTGVLTYEVWRFGWLRRLRGTSAEAVTVIAVIAFIVFWGTDKTLVYLAPLIFALAVLVFAAEGGAISRLLTTRLGGALGRWSYSIYMVHTLILALLFSGLSVLGVVAHHKWVVPHGPGGSLIIDLGGQVADNLAILAYLGVVVALAAFAWRFVERPGQLYFNRLAVAQKLEIYTQTV